jgi:2-polyprenyl-3-methyl-5-hydroxy-6-metoxy-1,4-benzoquinol methylase
VARTYVAPFNSQEYTLHDCRACRLEFWTPLRIEADFYEDEGFAAYADYHQGGRPFPPWCGPFFEKMASSSGRLLDVGCGDGAFLARARASGFETWGMDLDKNSVQAAKTRYQLVNVEHSSLRAFVEHCQEHAITFDVITFFEVLEHQDNPSEFLDLVLSILNPGGHIAGSVPNARRFLAALDRKISPGDLPPHHFLWFSGNTLKRFFSSKAFVSVLVLPSGNITFKELRVKFAALLYKKMFGGNPSTFTRLLFFPAVLLAACYLWMGYRWRPAHLYFQAARSLQNTING